MWKMLGNIIKILYDHYKIILGVILASIVAIIGFDQIVSWIQFLLLMLWTPIAGWVAFLLIILIVLFNYFKKESSVDIAFINTPPPFKIQDAEPIVYLSVVWKPWTGHRGTDMYTNQEEREIWVDGPYCPKCDYELDRNYKKHRWECIRCNKKFSIPSNMRDDTQEKVIKILEAERRKANKKVQLS